MFDDYRDEVILAYHEKKASSAFPINLRSLAPGKLRDECILVYKERFSDDDYEALRSFFGPRDNRTGYSQTIENIDIDKFRPLINFINGRTNKTERKNIELLAWLIDFKSRPYALWSNKKEKFQGDPHSVEEIECENPKDSSTIQNRQINTEEELNLQDDERPIDKIENECASEVESQFLDKEKESIGDVKEKVVQGIQQVLVRSDEEKIKTPMNKVKVAVASLIILALVSGGTYMALSNTSTCMYWTGDEYQALGCKIKKGDTLVIPLDEQKMANFKRITRPDTLTKRDLSKVWYMSIKRDTPELYTDSGDYPMDTRRRLKPMTEYMLNKYFLRK